MDMGGRLKPSYKFLEPILGHFEPGNAVSLCIAWFTFSTVVMCVYIQYWFNMLHINWMDVIVLSFLIVNLLICTYKNVLFNIGY